MIHKKFLMTESNKLILDSDKSQQLCQGFGYQVLAQTEIEIAELEKSRNKLESKKKSE